MRGAPRVTVLMLTFDRPQFIGRAIQSVVEQTFQDWELVVVQDGNHQQTVESMQEWVGRDSRIRHLHRNQPGNIGSALNHGIRHCRGELIAILDDDDIWAKREKLEKQVRFLDEHPAYVACGGAVRVIDAAGTPQMFYSKPREDPEIKAKALFANPMAHSTTVYRKQTAEAVGLYEESIPDFQDWDFWLKMGSAGKLYNFEDVFLDYRLWSGGSSFRKLRSNARSAVTIVKRHRNRYPGGAAAQCMAYLYLAYTYLPAGIRSTTYAMLSRFKKRTFSAGAGQGRPSASRNQS